MNAVVTVCLNEQYAKLAETTLPTIRAYAKKIGAEFVLLDKVNIAANWAHYEKYQLGSLLNIYDRIIYFDIDVLIRDDCPNLFDIVPADSFGAFNEGQFIEKQNALAAAATTYEFNEPLPKGYYNTGVMVLSRQHKALFQKPAIEMPRRHDAHLNLMLSSSKTKTFNLNYAFNRMPFLGGRTGEVRAASYVIHYRCGNNGIENATATAISDAASWAENAPKYEYKRNIFIRATGGIGDVVCAEPVIRYISEKAYPNANIVVAAIFPRVLSHLKVNLVELGKANLDASVPHFRMITMSHSEHPSWMFMSPNLSHVTDFTSQLCLRRILSDEDREIRLQVNKEDWDELSGAAQGVDMSSLVLVHPGKGWPSKTFPKAWWDEIISKLQKNGLRVGLIGHDMNENQGTVAVAVPPGTLDLRNKLTLGGLFAAISKAKVLITNDSSPVHIAGAFDNGIILIPSCKHPDHVLPSRHGSRLYKAKALYKKLTCDAFDSNPTQIHGQTVDGVIGDIMDYLPTTDEVVATANMMYLS